MAVTAVGLGVKAAKFAGKYALKKARGVGKNGDGNKKSKEAWITTIAIVVIIVYLVGMVVYSVGFTIAAVLGGSSSEVCNVSTPSGEAGEQSSPGGGGAADGTGGSNEPFPTESASKVFYPVPGGEQLVSSHVGMRQTPAGSQDFYGTGYYYHNGLDFAAPAGTPILAMADGIVAQAGPNSIGYGTSITIHHLINGKKYSTTYGHIQGQSVAVSVGDQVKGGQQIAGMGSEGNSTGSHLHFVLTDGVYTQNYSENNRGPQNNIDPFEFLKSNGATSTHTENIDGSPIESGQEQPVDCQSSSDNSTIAWGGHTNGHIPESAMTPLSWAPQFRLAPQAAAPIEGLNKLFHAKFGRNIPVVNAYMTQEQRPDSIFGWGKAVELDSSVRFGSEEYKFLMENGKKYNYRNPSMNREDGDVPRSTLWVYTGVNAVGGDENSLHEYAGKKLIERGHGDPKELTCLISMWTKESNWDPNAANPSSSARGIPQMMMNIHFGEDWETNQAGRQYLSNPNIQIDVGLDYIEGRYQTPCLAWDTWQKQSWY